MSNISTTNLPSGLTNAQLNTELSTYGSMDPTVFHTLFNDFNSYVGAEWTLTQVGATPPAPAIVAGDGGLLALATPALATDLTSIQSAASFVVVTGNQAWFKGRLNLPDATNSSLMFGLVNVTATPFTPAAVTDGIYFSKANGSTTLVGSLEIANAPTTINLATLSNNTNINIGWHYDGLTTLSFFVNGNPAGQIPISAMPTVNLAVTMAVMANTAAAQTLNIDYIFASTERSVAAAA